jgi:hypothetical protein
MRFRANPNRVPSDERKPIMRDVIESVTVHIAVFKHWRRDRSEVTASYREDDWL